MAGTGDLADNNNTDTGFDEVALLTQPPESPHTMEALADASATTGSKRRKSRLASGRSTKSVLEDTLLRSPAAAMGPGAEDDSNTKHGPPPPCDHANIAEVKAAKSQLDLLRDKGGNVKKVTKILRDLSGRDDIDYRVLLTTGIGKTMNKLTNHKSAKVSELALPLLQMWRLIDESTPKQEKIRIQEEVKREKAKLVPQPKRVTPESNEAVDLTDSPPVKSKDAAQPPQSKSMIHEDDGHVEVVSSSASKSAHVHTKIDESKSKENNAAPRSQRKKKEKALNVTSTVDADICTNEKEIPEARSEQEIASDKPLNAETAPSISAQNDGATTSTDRVSTMPKPPEMKEAPAKAPVPMIKKRKKRTFHDQILYTMLTSSKPYTLKTLAKACDSTVEALRHAMLSFIDKKLVICKEFPSKNAQREPKKLYWATQVTLSESERSSKGKASGAVTKELAKLLVPSEDIEGARSELSQLVRRYRGVQNELQPMLDVPSNQQLDEGTALDEESLRRIRGEIRAINDRIASASSPPAPSSLGAGRFQRPPARPRNPVTLKRNINGMLGEYKSRKRKCMEFVENLADAMEKKVTDVTGEKVLCLETDEEVWGQWTDEATGKTYGNPKPVKKRVGLLGQRKVNEELPATAVKLPAKYKDV